MSRIYGGIGGDKQMKTIAEYMRYMVSQEHIHETWHRRMFDDNIALAPCIIKSTVIKALFLDNNK